MTQTSSPLVSQIDTKIHATSYQIFFFMDEPPMETAQSCGVFNSLALCPTHDDETWGSVMPDGRKFQP